MYGGAYDFQVGKMSSLRSQSEAIPPPKTATLSPEIQRFIRRGGVELWPSNSEFQSEFFAKFAVDPYVRVVPWKGKIIGFSGKFVRPLEGNAGVFEAALNHLVMRELPSGRFTRAGETALLAGRVRGVRRVPLSLLECPGCGSTLVNVPELDFIAVDPIARSSAGEVLPAVKPQSQSRQAEDHRANISDCPGLQKSLHSLVLNEEVYEVGKVHGTTPFFLKNGSMPVREPGLARDLAKAAWAYENVIKSPSSLQGKSNVSMYLNTYKGIRRWEITQDILARAFVEATVAGITGGASLGKTIPGLTWGVVRDQFVFNLEFYLGLTARRGLERALAHYQQIEKLSSRSSGSKIDVKIAGQIYDLYQEAHTLELAFGRLLVSLMPKTGLDLVKRALDSVRNQLLQGLPIKNDPLTVGDAFNLLHLIAQEMNAYPPLREFSEKWSLSKRLVRANAQTISSWSDQAIKGCPNFEGAAKGSRGRMSGGSPGTVTTNNVAGGSPICGDAVSLGMPTEGTENSGPVEVKIRNDCWSGWIRMPANSVNYYFQEVAGKPLHVRFPHGEEQKLPQSGSDLFNKDGSSFQLRGEGRVVIFTISPQAFTGKSELLP